VRSLELQVDVTDAAGLGEPAHLALTVTASEELRDDLRDDPVVCFAKPGGGYGRGYFTEDLPGPARGAQAGWHAERGWVFVSLDHLGTGESSQHDPELLTFSSVVASSQAAETDVLQKLAAGTLMEGLGKIENPLKIGIGQSMGGSLTVVQQGRQHCYDGVAVLGYSPLRTQPPTAPGTPPLALPWVPRDTDPSEGVFTNGPALAELGGDFEPAADGTSVMAWGFHYDDIDPAVVRRDLEDYPARHGEVPPWGSGTVPMTVALWCMAPGGALAEAAAIRSPVLVALGERDVLVDPRGEPRVYESAWSVDLFVCPRMAHMHNFAGTRELLWQRIETWADWVRVVKRANEAGA